MAKKTITIPPEAGRDLLRSMERYFAEENVAKKGEIAVLARLDLLGHMPKGSKLRLTEVIELFYKMREEFSDG